MLFTIPLICLWHSSQKKVSVHLLKGVSVVLDWGGQCSERSKPPLVQGTCYSWHVHICMCPLEYTCYPLPLWEGDRAKWKKKLPPISSLLPMKAPRLELVFLELPEPGAPSSSTGSEKPQTGLYHHFLMELRTAKMGNISVTHQLSVGY